MLLNEVLIIYIVDYLVLNIRIRLICCHYNRYGKPSNIGYVEKLSSAFRKLREDGNKHDNYTPEAFFDGANGVGSISISEMLPSLKGLINLTLCNTGEGILNHMCGADYVKVRSYCVISLVC